MMLESKTLDVEWLNSQGLNLQAVFQLENLPKEVLDALEKVITLDSYRQLILLGHGGRTLWDRVEPQLNLSDEPIDDYSKQVTKTLLERQYPNRNYEVIYPSKNGGAIGLQRLGELAGWHFDSPFRVGINDQWGSWFAYRAAVLTDTNFEPTKLAQWSSPCIECETQECIQTCPADAISFEKILLNQCLDYRMAEESDCSDRCLARMACPIAKAHQYSLKQIQYHYGRSFKTLLKYRTR